MKKPLERDIQKACLDLLRLRGFFVWKQNTAGIRKPNGSYIPSHTAGMADIIGVAPGGRFVAVEVKRPGGRLTPAQQDFLLQVQFSDGLAGVVFSVDELNQMIRRWQKNKLLKS